jgi:prefoldin subunit 5
MRTLPILLITLLLFVAGCTSQATLVSDYLNETSDLPVTLNIPLAEDIETDEQLQQAWKEVEARIKELQQTEKRLNEMPTPDSCKPLKAILLTLVKNYQETGKVSFKAVEIIYKIGAEQYADEEEGEALIAELEVAVKRTQELTDEVTALVEEYKAERGRLVKEFDLTTDS